jgi:hypothetical protein
MYVSQKLGIARPRRGRTRAYESEEYEGLQDVVRVGYAHFREQRERGGLENFFWMGRRN